MARCRDYHPAIVIKFNGDTLHGEVVYKSEFDDQKEIFYRSSLGSQSLGVDEISKLIFNYGETYTNVNYSGDSRAFA